MSQSYSRRGFIQRIGAYGAAAVGLAAAVACDSGAKESAAPKPAAPKPAAPKPAPKPAATELTCTDISGLTDAEKGMRTTLKYTDKSPEAGKTCDSCQLYVAAPAAGKCGTCTVVKGPIHPKGYCSSWVAKAG